MPAAFDVEVLKLLIQVAFSDDEVQVEESRAILAAARRAGVDGELYASFEAALAGQAPPPTPNLGLLKARRDEALHLAREILEADGVVGEDEQQILELLAELLDG